MSGIDAQQDLFADLGLARAESPTSGTNKATDLGLNTFLKLMVTQLNNQDPFKPMENGDFLGQIAQFGSVTGLEKLNQNFESLAGSITSGQALQARGLVEREVLVPIEHPKHMEWLDQVLEFDLRDDIVRWDLRPDDSWERCGPLDEFAPDAQELMYEWTSERQSQVRR